MSRDYAKNFSLKNKNPSTRGGQKMGLWLTIFSIFIVGIGIGFLCKMDLSSLGLEKQKISAMMNKFKVALAPKKATKENIMAKNDPAVEQHSEVTFDFYTELPSKTTLMKEMADSPLKNTTIIPKKQLVTSAPTNVTEVPSKSIFSADDVANAIEAEVTQTRYVLQLGAFDSLVPAQTIRDNLSRQGCTVAIVEVSRNQQIVYRLQKGPYDNIDLAKQAQQDLQAKGIPSIIRKAL